MTSPFNATIYGWAVTQGPPALTGNNGFGPTPGPLFTLENSTFQPIADQTITPALPTSANLSADPATGVWFIYPTNPLSLDLLTPYNCDITLTAIIQGVNPNGGNALCDVQVNGTSVGTLSAGAQPSTQSVSIPYSVLAALNVDQASNINPMMLGAGSSVGSFVITSISVTSQSVDIYAQGQWVQLSAGNLPAGSSNFTDTVSVQSGTSSTVDESVSYANQLSITGSVTGTFDPSKLLSSIAVALSVGYTETKTVTNDHSLTLDTTVTNSYSYTINSSPTEPITYQIWQLVFLYSTAQGGVIEQYLGQADSPVMVNTYSPSSSDLSRVLDLVPVPAREHDSAPASVQATAPVPAHA